MSRKTMFVVILAAVCVMACVVGGCAPRQASDSSEQGVTSPGQSNANGTANDADADSGMQIDMASWSMDSDCSICHSKEQKSAQSSDCLASIHASNDCAACHDNESSLVEIHQSADSSDASKLKRLKEPVSEEACFACHGSWEELAAATAESTAMTDKGGRTVNPHDVPVTEGHTFELECTTCHTVHEAGDEPGAYCKTCHHEDLYECGTCH